jgi:ppGpp synthetase/RelA/SpoT-type nucleotidyltranferase/Tfp pilus assembly protein PilF
MQKIPDFIPDKKRIASQYEALTPVFNQMLQAMLDKLKAVIKLDSPPTYKARVKSFPHFYQKILKIKTQGLPLTIIGGQGNGQGEGLPLTTDVLGIRVICVFLEDLNAVVGQIKGALEVVEIERKGVGQKFAEFGYESIHVLVKIPLELLLGALAGFPEILSRLEDFGNILLEIQVRTILQDAWAEVEHDLVYKSEFSPFDLPLRRKLASINASLNLADILFQEIRDYQTKLHAELDYRRKSFYGKADTLAGFSPVPGLGTGQNSGEERAAPQADQKLAALSASPETMSVNPFLHGSIDELILEAIHAHNLADYETAIAIYTRIIRYDPRPQDVVLSVIYKHRGMAHFSKNDFSQALEDFTASIALNNKNAQSHYYSGIVHSLQNRNDQAVSCFAKSLEINPFQAHTSYRKALSEYALGDYGASLASLEETMKLGLDDQDVRRLHGKLLEKFEMKFGGP